MAESQHPSASQIAASPDAPDALEDHADQDPPAAKGKSLPWAKLGIFGALILGLVLFFVTGADQYLSFEAFLAHQDQIKGWVDQNVWLAVPLFLFMYFIAVTFSLPGAVWMTIIGGYLFGTIEATFYVVSAATMGATAVFLLARYVIGDAVAKKLDSGKMKKLIDGFSKDAFSYLLVLRLIPLFPFWVINLAPAMAGVKLRVYMAGTFLGIIPGTLVFSSVGNGLSSVIARGEKPDLGIIFDPEVLGPMLGLALLALIPVLYKKIKARKDAAKATPLDPAQKDPSQGEAV
ncbi:MAG: TVP38/TMEM64 family protein [Rhodospirillaceae bacterium]